MKVKKNKKEFVETLGLVDLQVNGFGGVDFNSIGLTPEKLQKSLEAILATGVLTFLPTIITESEKHLKICLSNLEYCRKALPLAELMIAGYHLEGPFISKLKGFSGCHPIQHICEFDQEMFFRLQEAAGGNILMVTLAPEVRGSISFIEKLTREGILVALGHTNASNEVIRKATEAGASLSTHLGNGTSSKLFKNNNPIISQLSEDKLSASFIADSYHIPPEVLKVYLKAKGRSRAILITDATAASSAMPGRYKLGNIELLLGADPVIFDKETKRPVGSAITMDQCVRNIIDWYNLSFSDAIRLAGSNPIELLRKSTRFSESEKKEKKIWWEEENGWYVKKIQCGNFFYSNS